MESAPDDFEMEQFENKLRGIIGVKNIHNIHVWNINKNGLAMACHVVGDKAYHSSILEEAKSICLEHKVGNMTI